MHDVALPLCTILNIRCIYTRKLGIVATVIEEYTLSYPANDDETTTRFTMKTLQRLDFWCTFSNWPIGNALLPFLSLVSFLFAYSVATPLWITDCAHAIVIMAINYKGLYGQAPRVLATFPAWTTPWLTSNKSSHPSREVLSLTPSSPTSFPRSSIFDELL